MNSDQVKAIMIVHEIYGKNVVDEAERKLAATMSFIKFFQSVSKSVGEKFDRKSFYDSCMNGTIGGA